MSIYFDFSMLLLIQLEPIYYYTLKCRKVYYAKQTAYHACCRARCADHCGRFVLARHEAQRVYGAARESHNERTWNSMKHSTCSHMRWETLKDSIFGEKPSAPALSGPGGGMVVPPAEKASLLGSQFDSKQCREQLSHICLVSLFLGSIFWPSGLLSFCVCFLILTHMNGAVDPLDVFPLFLKMVADIIVRKLSILFRGLIRRGSFLECWRSPNVTAIPKGAPSPDREN